MPDKIVYHKFGDIVLGLYPWRKNERKIVDAEGDHLGHMVRWGYGGDKNNMLTSLRDRTASRP